MSDWRNWTCPKCSWPERSTNTELKCYLPFAPRPMLKWRKGKSGLVPLGPVADGNYQVCDTSAFTVICPRCWFEQVVEADDAHKEPR